jgi:hypothetical protein
MVEILPVFVGLVRRLGQSLEILDARALALSANSVSPSALSRPVL